MSLSLKLSFFVYVSCFIMVSSFAKAGDLIYETSVSNDTCLNCPEYLKLLSDVHKVVSETPTNTSISNDNKIITEISNLRFMYYETRSILEDGSVGCRISQNQDLKNSDVIKRDRLSLLSEKVLENQAIRSFQFYPKNTDEEVHYFYRGKGIQENLVIEVIVKKDFSAVVRYHYYEDQEKTASSDAKENPGQTNQRSRPASFTQQPSLDIASSTIEKLPTSQIQPGVYLDRQANIQGTNQVIDVRLSNSSGENQLKAVTTHNGVKGDINLATSIPIQYDLTREGGGLGINGAVSAVNNINYRSDEKSHNENLTLALTDKGQEYLQLNGTSDANSIRRFNVVGKLPTGKSGTLQVKYEDDGQGGKNAALNGERAISSNLTMRAGYGRDSNNLDSVTYGARVANKDGDFIDVSQYGDAANFDRLEVKGNQGVRENSSSESRVIPNSDGSTRTVSSVSSETTSLNAQHMNDSNHASSTTVGFNTELESTRTTSFSQEGPGSIAAIEATRKVNISGHVNRERAAVEEFMPESQAGLTETIGGKIEINGERRVVTNADSLIKGGRGTLYSASATIEGSVTKTSENERSTKFEATAELGSKITLGADYSTDTSGERSSSLSTEVALNRDAKIRSGLTRNTQGLDTVSVGGDTKINGVGRVGLEYSGQFSEDSERPRSITARYSVNRNQTDYNVTASHNTVTGTAFKLQAEKRIRDYISMSVSVERNSEDRIFLYQMAIKH